MRLLFVMLGRMAELSGVTNAPVALSTAMKLEVENSSTISLVFESRYSTIGKPAFFAEVFGKISAA